MGGGGGGGGQVYIFDPIASLTELHVSRHNEMSIVNLMKKCSGQLF